MEELKRCPDLHLHSKDIGDCDNPPEAVCKRQKELGAKGFALTQHGTLSGIEPMRKAAEKYGLKFIPGVEAYLDTPEKNNCHLILLAMDDIGYKAVWKAVTDGNRPGGDGYARLDMDVLVNRFAPGTPGHGHVVSTSACIAGPLGSIFSENTRKTKEIEKIEKKIEKLGFDRNAYDLACSRALSLTDKIEQLAFKKIALDKSAKTSFKKREKDLLKYEGALRQEKEKQLLAEKAAAAADAEKAKEVAEEIASLKKERSATEKIVNAGKAALRNIDALQEQKDSFRYLSHEELVEKATERALMFRDLFGEGNFYLEVQYHGIKEEREIYPELAKIAKKTGIPLVATNDCHLITGSTEERLQRQILRSKRFNVWQEEMEGDAELYIKTDEEMKKWLRKILPEEAVTEGMENAAKILDRADVRFEKGQHYPKFPIPEGKDINEVFEEEIREGVKWRFPYGMDEVHTKRLRQELPVIENMGYADYLLIVKDFLEYARLLGSVPAENMDNVPLTIPELREYIKKNNWPAGFSVGPGRGSAAGSLICYVLGITNIDPLNYGLLFERFLNPERVSMPDIDSDISKKVRPKVIEYLKHKYGERAVCGIMTVNALAPKGAIRDAAKYYGQAHEKDRAAMLSVADRLAKLVPSEVGTSFSTKYEETLPDVLKQMETKEGDTLYDILYRNAKDDTERGILEWAKCFEGSFTSYGAHAAGIIISDNADVSDYIPLRWNKELGEYTTQCDMVCAEEAGLLKFDLLGLKTLDVITDCILEVFRLEGTVIDPLQIRLDDKEVYKKIYQEGHTKGVFQVEKNAMTKTIVRFSPTVFEDIILLVSIYRPGPLQYIDDVISVKHGEKPRYLIKELEPILKETYGSTIYQEQVMAIFRELAGYSLGGADNVRRFMSKKKHDKLAAEKPKFIEGCAKRGIDPEKAKVLFEQMEEFSKYCFNKSHGACYAFLSYICAWLKVHYATAFYMASLNWIEDPKKLAGLMQDARETGVPVVAPNVNASESRMSVKDGRVLFGLGQVKNVGRFADVIIKERAKGGSYKSLENFMYRTLPPKNILESLIDAGALDGFRDNRLEMKMLCEQYRPNIKDLKEKKKKEADCRDLLSDRRWEEYTNKEFADYLQQRGITETFKTRPSVKSVQKRLDNALLSIEKSMQIMGAIEEPYVKENLKERMLAEAELLGTFVTAHPLDGYPNNAETGTVPIDSLSGGRETVSIYGFVKSLTVKFRKKDKHPMSFFDLEDRSGSVSVKVFCEAYDRNPICKDLADWDIVKVSGKVTEEETPFKDDEGNTIYVPRFVAEKIEPVSHKVPELLMDVSSYVLFHIDMEESFRKAYEVPEGTGARIYVCDGASGKYRRLGYNVAETCIADYKQCRITKLA